MAGSLIPNIGMPSVNTAGATNQLIGAITNRAVARNQLGESLLGMVDRRDRAEQQAAVNKQADARLGMQYENLLLQKAQEGRAVDKASREEAARQAKEEIAKTVVGVDRYGQAGILTPEVTQARADKVIGNNKGIIASQEAAGKAYEDSFNRNLAELQEANTQVVPQTERDTRYTKGSIMDYLANYGNTTPTITSMTQDELVTQAAEIANRESGIMNVQDTTAVPKVAAATYGDRPLLSATALKQAQIDAVLVNPDIPDSMKAEYVMSANKADSVAQQRLELDKEILAIKKKEGFYAKDRKNRTSDGSLKQLRKIAELSGNPAEFMQGVQLLKNTGATYDNILDRAIEKGGSSNEALMDTPWYNPFDWGAKDISLLSN